MLHGICLGLSNKKDYVERVMNENSIDICCMQEVEIGTNIDTSLLSTINYSPLLENNELEARTGLYESYFKFMVWWFMSK